MNKRILAKQKKVAEANMAYVATVRDVQKKCGHKIQAECDYEPSYFQASAPIRICLECGLTEEGWGCGYKVLTAPAELVGTISRDRVYRERHGLYVNDERKTPLIRKELTLDELIDGRILENT